MNLLYLIPFILIVYGLAIYEHKKQFDTWLMPWKWCAGIIRALFAKNTIIRMVDRSNSEYAEILVEELQAGLEHTSNLMASTGWSIKSYISKELKCTDFAFEFKAELTKFLAENNMDNGKGIPVGVFGYTRDSDAVNHALCYCLAEGDVYFFEAFPESCLTFKELSKNEIASCSLDII